MYIVILKLEYPTTVVWQMCSSPLLCNIQTILVNGFDKGTYSGRGKGDIFFLVSVPLSLAYYPAHIKFCIFWLGI